MNPISRFLGALFAGIGLSTLSTGLIVSALITGGGALILEVSPFWVIALATPLVVTGIGFALINGVRFRHRINHLVEIINMLPDLDFASFEENMNGVVTSRWRCNDHRIEQGIIALHQRHLTACREAQGEIETRRSARKQKVLLFAGMSHDLKGPLNSIVGFTDLLHKQIDGPLDDHQRPAVVALGEAAEKLVVHINDIVDAAKLDADRFELIPDWVPVVELLGDCQTSAIKLMGNRSIEFNLEMAPGLHPVYLDGPRLTRAVSVLLLAIIEEHNSGSIGLKAQRISQEASKPAFCLRLFAPDMAFHRRQRLYQSVQQAIGLERAGTGLVALEIRLARDIIGLHGGRLDVHNPDDRGGRGSLFTITLPGVFGGGTIP